MFPTSTSSPCTIKVETVGIADTTAVHIQLASQTAIYVLSDKYQFQEEALVVVGQDTTLLTPSNRGTWLADYPTKIVAVGCSTSIQEADITTGGNLLEVTVTP